MQWNKAVEYYSEAIKLNGTNATYYNNRAAAYLELGWYSISKIFITLFIALFCVHILPRGLILDMQLPTSRRGLQYSNIT